MSKSKGTMAEQIAALGLAIAEQARTKGKYYRQKSDPNINSVRHSQVSDLEAEMIAREAASAERRNDSGGEGQAVGKGKRRLPEFTREIRRRPPSRAIDPSNRPSKAVKPPRELGSQLTTAAKERLRYEPEPLSETEGVQPLAEAENVSDEAQISEAPKVKCLENLDQAEPPTYSEVFKYISKIVSSATPSIEPRPTTIKASDAHKLDTFTRRGSEWLREHPEPDFDNGYVVGFDFGTSSLKVVVREPYRSGNDVAAMPAPEQLRSQGHPYLWQTVVWFDPADQTFLLHPGPGAIPLEGFKTGIIGGTGSEPILDEPRILRSEAASAFIALQLCNLLGWFEVERPLPRCHAENFLGVNIGVPVATQDDPKALEPFKKVVLAAVELAKLPTSFTLCDVRDALEMVSDEELPKGFELVPELSAALVGYALDDTSPWGAHVLIDVGASTMDIVAFNLVEFGDEPQIKAFSASVELLGAAALEIARDREVADEDFAKACNHQFGDTFGYACREDIARSSFSPTFRSKDVQLVITGGGCDTSVHAGFIDELPGRVLGQRDFERPCPPAEIATLECDRSRLLLAYGLAHDHPDIPHPTLPSRIPRIPKKQAGEQTYIGPEMI